MTLTSQDYQVLTPYILLTVWACILLLVDLFVPKDRKGITAALAALGLALTLGFTLSQIGIERTGFFGMVVLEAMAASLPVIISSGVGAKDLVEEGVNGFVVADCLDAERAAGRLGLLLDEKRRSEMGKAAFLTASRHDWDALAKKMGDLYMEALTLKGRVRPGA